MMTARQIERQWTARAYNSLFSTLNAARPESDFAKATKVTPPAAAALAIIRLDELTLARAPSTPTWSAPAPRKAVDGQPGPGGWGDPAITALCLRHLLCSNGQGTAISRGLHYLAELQKPEGIWPGLPNRRMPLDPLVSAYVLYELGDRPEFRRRRPLPGSRQLVRRQNRLPRRPRPPHLAIRRRRCHCRLPPSPSARTRATATPHVRGPHERSDGKKLRRENFPAANVDDPRGRAAACQLPSTRTS